MIFDRNSGYRTEVNNSHFGYVQQLPLRIFQGTVAARQMDNFVICKCEVYSLLSVPNILTE